MIYFNVQGVFKPIEKQAGVDVTRGVARKSRPIKIRDIYCHLVTVIGEDIQDI